MKRVGGIRGKMVVSKVRVILSISKHLKYLSRKGVPRMLYLTFAKAKEISKVGEFMSMFRLQCKTTLKRIGTYAFLATISVLLVGELK